MLVSTLLDTKDEMEEVGARGLGQGGSRRWVTGLVLHEVWAEGGHPLLPLTIPAQGRGSLQAEPVSQPGSPCPPRPGRAGGCGTGLAQA